MLRINEAPFNMYCAIQAEVVTTMPGKGGIARDPSQAALREFLVQHTA